MNIQGPFMPLLNAAQSILFQKWRAPVQFSAVERLTKEDRRSIVLRISLDNTSNSVPSTVILKKANLDAYPEAEREFARKRFAGDWAGNDYLSGLPGGSRHSPKFYGGDLTQQFILIEDMGDVPTLVDPLLRGDAAQAETALLTFAARQGQMHADTVRGFSAFEQIAHPVNAPLQPYFHHNLDALVELVKERCTEWNIPFPDAIQRDLHRIVQSIRSPGPFLAYIHADPCPDNMYFVNGSYRLIDFETSGFSHALADAVYFRMSFPTCWCANRVPDEIVEKAEQVYREELAHTCPEAEDDNIFYPALVEMCGYRAMVELGYWARRADEKDRDWGIATLRPRVVTRLRAFIRAAEQFGHLPALRELCEQGLKAFESRWQGVEGLPVYPAFS